MGKKAIQLLLGIVGLCMGVPALCVGVLTMNEWYQASRPVDCSPFVNDPALAIPLDITSKSIQEWASQAFTSTEGWDFQRGNSEVLVVRWFGNGTEHRAFFNNQTDEFNTILHRYWIGEGLSGQQLINCFGDPTYYQAVWEPNPHGQTLAFELIYPTQGLIFRGYHPNFPFVDGSVPYDWTEFGEVRYFAPVESRDEVAPFVSNLFSGTWDDEGWAEVALREWEGWDTVQIVDYESLPDVSPRAPATATAIAATFLTTPPFPTQEEPSSPACQTVINPSLYNLHYGTATLEETRLLVNGLNQHFFGAENYRVESSSRSYEGTTWEVLTWAAHTANFENNLLQNVESRVQRARIAIYLSCLGEPDAAILSLRETAEGTLQSLYLFFPKQGIVTATYLYDDEITAPNDSFPVMMVYQSSPQTDSVALLHAAFNFSDETTYAEWEGNLQSWQGFEQLRIME